MKFTEHYYHLEVTLPPSLCSQMLYSRSPGMEGGGGEGCRWCKTCAKDARLISTQSKYWDQNKRIVYRRGARSFHI